MFDIKVSDIPKLLRPQYLFAVAVATGLLLFLPDSAVAKLGLDRLQELVRPWLGIAFILAVTLLVTQGVSVLYEHVVSKRKSEAATQRRNQSLHALTAEEQEILRRFISAETKTRELVVNSGVVTGLMGKGILYLSSQMAHKNMFVSHTDYFGQVNMNDWAWDHLREHPQLLGLQVHQLTRAA